MDESFLEVWTKYKALDLPEDETVHLQVIVEAADGSECSPIVNGISFFMPSALERQNVPMRLLAIKPFLIILIDSEGARPRPCIGGFLTCARHLRLAAKVPGFSYYWPRYALRDFIRNYRIVADADDYYIGAIQRAQQLPEDAFDKVITPLVNSFQLSDKQTDAILLQARALIQKWN